MNRYICIHGHFYQPPRENPWLEEVELQDSAYPYHDWNERITSECYAPNTASRILNNERKIVDIVNNYSHISFNFGPTLLSWMEKHTPEDYQNILDADRKSQKRFSGHGSALAQVYNHMIMPLANTRDERTQVYWGIRDFEHHFQRKPEGMWLAETAVNTETLEILAEYGIKFTILAPHQAGRVRKIGEERWESVKGAKINPQMPYRCLLPSGKSIVLFFYDGPISRELAFENLLKNGENFANRLLGAFSQDTKQPQLVHIATDGETYGHHQYFGDMALTYCFHHIESNKLANITVYGEFLEKFPPTHEVEIIDDTSWSCAHGIERWKSDCGCSTGGDPGWHQKWREPLRNGLDWLRESLIPAYEQEMGKICDDPWKMREDYIDVILDRSVDNIENFFRAHTHHELSVEEKVKALKLLELQRHAMLMYTSCGWFFNELSGIETAQVLLYAARAIQLAKETLDIHLEDQFIRLLERAPSNIEEFQNGAVIYQKLVKPAIIDLLSVGAHYAVSSLFEDYSEETNIYCYTAISEFHDERKAGNQKIVIGRSRIRSDITWEEHTISYAVVHMGLHNLNGGVRNHMGDENFNEMHREIKTAFSKGDLPSVIRLMNSHFGTNNYSLQHLFKDEQKRIFDEIIGSTLVDLEAHFRQIYELYYPLMHVKDVLHIPLPKVLAISVEFILNRDLLDLLQKDKMDIKRLENIVEEVKRWSFEIDRAALSYIAGHRINILMEKLQANPKNFTLLKSLEATLRNLSTLNLEMDLWKAQNFYFAISKDYINGKNAEAQELVTGKWFDVFNSLGNYLQVKSD